LEDDELIPKVGMLVSMAIRDVVLIDRLDDR
jgi:hypothetical protein